MICGLVNEASVWTDRNHKFDYTTIPLDLFDPDFNVDIHFDLFTCCIDESGAVK